MDAEKMRTATRALLTGSGAIPALVLGAGAAYAVTTAPHDQANAVLCATCTAAVGGWCTWYSYHWGVGGSYCTYTEWQGDWVCGQKGYCSS